MQGCALAEPSGPWRMAWRLTFALGRLEKPQIFHTNHMLGTLDFTVSEHWASFRSKLSWGGWGNLHSEVQPLIFGQKRYPSYTFY